MTFDFDVSVLSVADFDVFIEALEAIEYDVAGIYSDISINSAIISDVEITT